MTNLRTTLNGQELTPGLTFSHPSNVSSPSFEFHAVAETVTPITWRATVRLSSRTIITTDPASTDREAVAAAERILIDRLARVLGDSLKEDVTS